MASGRTCLLIVHPRLLFLFFNSLFPPHRPPPLGLPLFSLFLFPSLWFFIRYVSVHSRSGRRQYTGCITSRARSYRISHEFVLADYQPTGSLACAPEIKGLSGLSVSITKKKKRKKLLSLNSKRDFRQLRLEKSVNIDVQAELAQHKRLETNSLSVRHKNLNYHGDG